MYYEEKLIDGVWQWRGTPDGEWRTMGVATLTRMLAAATERERAAQYQCGECGEVHETWLYAMECCADQDEAAASQPASDGGEGK